MCVSGYILREETRCLLSGRAGAGGSADVWMYMRVCERGCLSVCLYM